MAQLVIKDEELKQLDNILGEIPTKYGVHLVNFFNGVAQKRAVETQKIAESIPPEASTSETGESIAAD